MVNAAALGTVAGAASGHPGSELPNPAPFAPPGGEGCGTPGFVSTGPLGIEPFFALEVGGTAVREGIASEHRRILHGPPLTMVAPVATGSSSKSEDPKENSASAPCPPFLLGRAQQSGFWQRLLVEEAFHALSRQHLQIEVSEERGSGAPLFFVRNLSERNPIRVCGSLEDAESSPALARDQRRPLSCGDVIMVNPNRGSTLWLVFRDMMARKAMPRQGVETGKAATKGDEVLTRPNGFRIVGRNAADVVSVADVAN